MRALTFHGGRDVRCEDVPDPRIVAPTDAIVRVERTAVCGSDLHVYHERERGLDRGTVMGHEFTGTVLETGRDVARFRPGDRVVSPFTTSCGDCFFCRDGLTARCVRGQLYGWVENGEGLHGAQAEAVRVPLADATLFAIPEGVDADAALLLGDVLATGWFCAEMAEPRRHPDVAVVGCGPVGLMGVLGARAQGARRVFAIDRVPERLALAERFGAIPVDPGADPGADPVAALREATGGRGADAVMELVGSPGAGRLAWKLVRPGGTIAVVGVHNEPEWPFTPAEAYDKNLTFRVGRCPVRRLMPGLARALAEGALGARPEEIVTHRFPLERGPDAYRLFDRRQDGCIKVVLRP